MAYEEENGPRIEDKDIIIKIRNDLNTVDSEMDWVSLCNHCRATGKTNQNQCMVCKVGDLDDENKFHHTRMEWCEQCGETSHQTYKWTLANIPRLCHES